MEWFSGRALGGGELVLRVPTARDLRCLESREAEVGSGARRAGSPLVVEMPVMDRMSAPVWMLRSPACSAPDCDCQLVDLSWVLELLSPPEQVRAVVAHLRVLSSINAHLSAAEHVVTSSLLGEVCVECLTATLPHIATLRAEVGERVEELQAALSLHRTRLRSA